MACIAVIRNFGILVKIFTDTVTDIFSYNRKTVVFDIALYRITNIADSFAFADRGDALKKALLGHFDKPLSFIRNSSYCKSSRAIAVIAFIICAHVDLDYIAVLQYCLF